LSGKIKVIEQKIQLGVFLYLGQGQKYLKQLIITEYVGVSGEWSTSVHNDFKIDN